jgi:hypothetical protein
MALRPAATARTAGAIALVAAVGCARQGMPPGGPPDLQAPVLVAVSPESLAVRVPVDAPLRITWSEKVDPATLEKALWVTPGGTVKPKISLSGETAVVKLAVPYPESTTVGVLITTVLADQRREGRANRIHTPIRWVFSTGDSVWPGRLEGKVDRVGGSPSGQTLVALYAPSDTVPDPVRSDPVAITEADSSGDYDLIGLPVDGARRWLFGLYDRDGNREIRGDGEFVSAEAESVILTPESPMKVIPLRLVDPHAPGSVEGAFPWTQADTVRVAVELRDAAADSTAPPRYRGAVTRKGTFALDRIPPGSYRVLAFCDLNANGKRDDGEPVSYYGTIEVKPGAKTALSGWNGPACGP